MDFKKRWLGRELIDDPECDETLLIKTVDHFEWINRMVGRYRSILSRFVLADMMRDKRRLYHFVDLGAGGCDIAVWLLEQAKRKGLHLHVTAIDANRRLVEHARAKYHDVIGLDIHHADVGNLRKYGPADYVFMNHVLHHLPDAFIPQLLAQVRKHCKRRWIISDLLRSKWSYAAFHAVGYFARTSFAFEDGRRSIRRAFTTSDLKDYLGQAGLTDTARILQVFPGRLVMIGER